MWFFLSIAVCIAITLLVFSRLGRGRADDERDAARANADAERQKYNWFY
jgi:hypothetical protein